MFKSIVSVLLVCTLLMVGCTPPNTSQLITALNAVSEASSVAVVVTESLVALGKISPSVGNEVSVYATGVSGAVTTSIAELNSTDTNPVKIANITAAFAKVAVPAFGNKAPAITAAILAVTAAIDIFLGQLNSSGTLKVAKAAPKVSPTFLLSKGDKAMLKQITNRTVEVLAVATQLAVAK